MRHVLALVMLVSACSAPAAAPGSDPLSDCRAPWSGPAKHRGYDPLPPEVHVSGGRLVLPAAPVESAYSHARDELAASRWDRAATEFRSLAFAHPESEVGIYAAELYLRALNILRVEADRPSCIEDMRRDLPALRALYCGPGHADNESGCGVLGTLQGDLESGSLPPLSPYP